MNLFKLFQFRTGFLSSVLIFLSFGNAMAQTAINSWQDLDNVRNNLSGNYILNVDLNEYSPGYDTYASASANGGLGWEPLGNLSSPFTGTFDGNNKIINGLFINRPEAVGVGFFGRTIGATITNLTLANVDITGSHEVGGLIGTNREGTVTLVNHVHVTGAVTSARTGNNAADCGGLLGYIYDINVTNSSTSVSVTAIGRNVGGIVGDGVSNSSLSNCFATGPVTSTGAQGHVGGFAGLYRGNGISNSFSLGSVTRGGTTGSTSVGAGGFIGRLSGSASEITNCYSIGKVTSADGVNTNMGGFVGTGATVTSTLSNCYWDTDVSNLTDAYGDGTKTGVNGRTTAQMKTQGTFSGWNFSTVWSMSSPLTYNGYPALDYTSPVGIAPSTANEIATLANLLWIAEDVTRWNGNYTQTADINTVFTFGWDGNASASSNYTASGWLPIGNSTTKFTGSYNGDGHTISNLFINRPNNQRIALFGQTDGATIQNLGLMAPTITVTGSGFGIGSNVGSLVGLADNGTNISQCFANGGSVTALGSGVGGLIGQLWNSSLNNSYAIVAVDGASDGYSAGLVGVNTSSTITNSYAAGSVVLNQEEVFPGTYFFYSKGLTQNNGGTVNNSFYDSEATGQSTGSGTAKTTAEMQQQSTFINWDFQCELSNGADDIWGIDEGNDYPVLSRFGYIQTCPDNVQVANSSGADGSYFSLADAFFAIDAAGSQAGNSINVILKTNQSIGTSLVVPTGDWNLIRIYPNTAGLSLSGTIDGPLLDFNGSDNIIIDGRVNASGTDKDLIIENLSTGSNASTLRFRNGAQNNTVQYAIVRGSSGGSASGVVHFAGSANGANSGNTIANNDITNSGGDRPLNVIFSSGSASPNNNVNNTIEANHIFNFIRLTGISYGIHLAAQTTDWVIEGNSMYETSAITATNAGERIMIRVNNSSTGNNFQIINNFLGGNAAGANGVFDFSTSTAIPLTPIVLSVGATSPSSIQGNIIRGFDWKTTPPTNAITSAAIRVTAGHVNIGTVSGNIIGSTTGDSKIVFNHERLGAAGAFIFYSIEIFTNVTAIVSNNTIAGIEMTYNRNSQFRAISKTGAGNFTATNNIVGSSAAPIIGISSIYLTIMTGIYSNGTGMNTISGNTVSNFQIQISNTTSGHMLFGIDLVGNTDATAIIEKNFVHSLSSNTNSTLTGIRFTGQVNVVNNIVTLTSTSPAVYRGISDFSTATRNVFYNSIYLDGVPSAGSSNNSFAYFNDSETGTKIIQNNIFENRKSTNGNHYAVRLAGIDNTSIDYNNYRSVGATGGFIGQIASTDYSDFSSWQTATGQDANSLSIDPQFVNAGGTDPANYETAASLPGIAVAGIETDYFGNNRNPNAPQMGAHEEDFNPTPAGSITITNGASSSAADWVLFQGKLMPLQNNPSVNVDVVRDHLLNVGDLIIEAPVDVIFETNTTLESALTNNRTLTLKAGKDVEIKQNAEISVSGNSLNLIIWSDADGNDEGMIWLRTSSSISTNGGHLWMGGGEGTATWNGLTVGDDFATGSDAFIPDDNTSTSQNGYNGITLDLNVTIQTGEGDIELNGRSGEEYAPNIGTNPYSVNVGVYLGDGSQTFTTSGNISMNGIARLTDNQPTSGCSSCGFRYGILFHRGSQNSNRKILISSQSGNIVLDGLVEDYTGSTTDRMNSGGVTLFAGTQGIVVSTDGGNIDILGNNQITTLPTGRTARGVWLTPGQTDVTSNSGSISIEARLVNTSTQPLALQADTKIGDGTSGDIVIRSNEWTGLTSSTLINGSGDLRILPTDETTSIGISGASGTLALISAYFSTNFASSLSNIIIGSENQTGNISVNAFNLAHDMTLLTSGNVSLGGKPELGTHNVTLGKDIANISGTPTHYFQTNGTGQVVREIPNTEQALLPIGNASYNPVSITNNSSANDNFSARVIDDVFLDGLSGAAITTPHVKVTWDINKTNANTSSGVDFVFQWNEEQEVGTLTANDYKLNHHNGTNWEFAIGTSGEVVSGTPKTMVHTGYTGTFSPFAIGTGENGVPLPVELLQFNAKAVNNEMIALHWVTSTEINNEGFEVQRSIDGINFETIGWVEGNGNSTIMHSYEFNDSEPHKSINYYRLKQVDFDGQYKYSNIVAARIKMGALSHQMIVYPNPASDRVNIDIESSYATITKITISDIAGKQLLAKEINLEQGWNAITLDTAHLVSGVYYLSIDSKDQPMMQKVVIAR